MHKNGYAGCQCLVPPKCGTFGCAMIAIGRFMLKKRKNAVRRSSSTLAMLAGNTGARIARHFDATPTIIATSAASGTVASTSTYTIEIGNGGAKYVLWRYSML